MEHLGTVEKASELLFFLSSQRVACGVSSIAAALKLPKSSVHRLLQSLRHRDLVQKDFRGRYQLGVGLIPLGLGAAGGDPLLRSARPVLERLAESFGETYFVVTARAGALFVLDKAEGSGVLRASPRVGSEVPVHATAVGKVYLAFAPELVRVDPELRVFTRQTLRTRGELDEAARAVRQRGYAESHEEWLEGLSAVAAPILARGRLAGAFVMATITHRLDELSVPRVSRSVVEGARDVAVGLEGVN